MLFFLGFTLALIMFTVLFFDIYLTNKYFRDYEQRVSSRDLSWAHKLIDHEADHLVAFLGDWTSRDETRRFVEQQNPDYIERNLDTRVFASVGINYVALLDSNRRIL